MMLETWLYLNAVVAAVLLGGLLGWALVRLGRHLW